MRILRAEWPLRSRRRQPSAVAAGSNSESLPAALIPANEQPQRRTIEVGGNPREIRTMGQHGTVTGAKPLLPASSCRVVSVAAMKPPGARAEAIPQHSGT